MTNDEFLKLLNDLKEKQSQQLKLVSKIILG